MFRSFLELCRISNLPTVWTNVTAAWVLGGGPLAETSKWLWLLLGASLVYSAGMILNDTFDATWDQEKRPERPIPSGRVPLSLAWSAGIVGLVAGYGLMLTYGGSAWLFTTALVGAIVLYDAYHKPWTGSVFVMGACRTLLYMAAASAAFAVQRHLHQGAVIILEALIACPAVVSGAYVVALTLIARAEGKGAIKPEERRNLTLLLMVPAAYAVAAAILTTCITSHRQGPTPSPLLYTVVPLAAFVGWTWNALRQMRKGGPAIGQAVGLLLAGIPLVDAINIAVVEPSTALAFCLLPPLLRYWQRWVAAT